MALVLARRVGEQVRIGDDVLVTVTEIRGGQVKLSFAAPREIAVWREEIKRGRQPVDLERAKA